MTTTTIEHLINPEFVGLELGRQLQEAQPGWRAKLNHFLNTWAQPIRPSLPITLAYLSDNGGEGADLARAEIKRHLHDYAALITRQSGFEKPEIIYEDVPAQNWIAGAFDLAQLTRQAVRGPGNITFLNCAPRLDQRGKEGNNKGEPIYIGILANGNVISANSAHSFVFFRDLIENGALEIYEAKVQIDGTQFRSRDIFPLYALLVADRLARHTRAWQAAASIDDRRKLLQRLNFIDTNRVLMIATIPILPHEVIVVRTDVHGNLKTNKRWSELPPALRNHAGQRVSVVINGNAPQEAILSPSMFDRLTGQIGLSSGSSGQWEGQDGFVEISIIGGNACQSLALSAEDLRRGAQVQILGSDKHATATDPASLKTIGKIYR